MPWLGWNYYDTRPTAEGWKWSAFDVDSVRPLAKGTASSEAAARKAALNAIAASGQADAGAGRPMPGREP